MCEFRLKIVMREEFRTRVNYGKFGRLSYVRILFTYNSKAVRKSIIRVHVSAEKYLPKRYGGCNLLPLYLTLAMRYWPRHFVKY